MASLWVGVVSCGSLARFQPEVGSCSPPVCCGPAGGCEAGAESCGLA